MPRAPRLVPNDYITVVDSNSQEKVGSVMNFNEAGMQLLITKEDVELNDILELTLVSKSNESTLQYIKVIADLLWMKKDENHGRLNQLIKSLN